jgi:hypothetical protein
MAGRTMEILAAALVVLVLVTWWISRVNAKYEKKKEQEGDSVDVLVRSAWDQFGLADEDDPTGMESSFDRLMAQVDVSAMRDKTALVQLAIMAVRSGRTDSLPAIAEQIEQVAPGCGETRSIQGLAEAYAGDPSRARALLIDAQRATAGCSSCGSTVEAKILTQEIVLALHALEGEDGNLGSAGRAINVRLATGTEPSM